MRIPNNLLDCVFYLYKNIGDAKTGVAAGGCGFFVSVGSDRHGATGCGYRYAVTCRHLLDKGFLTIRVNTRLGEPDYFETVSGNWERSSDNDVAAYGIDLSDEKHLTREVYHRISPVLVEQYPRAFHYGGLLSFVTEEIINEHGIGIGDEVFLVGRLIDHSGKQKNAPSARFGNISMTPFESIFNKTLSKNVEVFLCEVKSIGGFSGSPVFVYVRLLLGDQRIRRERWSAVRGCLESTGAIRKEKYYCLGPTGSRVALQLSRVDLRRDAHRDLSVRG